MPDLNFNFDTVPAAEVIPPGTYTLECVKADLKLTRDQSGLRLNCQMRITEGQFVGRTFFHGFNYKNKNQQAQEISHRQLKDFGESLGLQGGIKSTDDLENKRFKAEVKITPAQGGFEPGNEVKKFIKAEVPPHSQVPAQSAPPARAPASNGAQAPAPSADPDKPVWAGN